MSVLLSIRRKRAFGSVPFIMLLALVLVIHPSGPPLFDLEHTGVAYADDDDSGDGGSSASSGAGSGNESAGSRATLKKSKVGTKRVAPKPKNQRNKKQLVIAQSRSTPPQPKALLINAPHEIVALGLSGSALNALEEQGYRIVQRQVVRSLSQLMVRLSVPDNVRLSQARSGIELLGGSVSTDLNHFYRTTSEPATVSASLDTALACKGGHCAALQQISWPLTGSAPRTCAKDMLIGMVDTGINPRHEAFIGQTIELIEQAMPGLQKSGLQHGTAVAAILVGGQTTRTPGVLPNANLLAVDVFHRVGGDERADVFAIVKALDTLHQRGVKLINMSLAGPQNSVLERMIGQMVADDLVIVAAAGNDGPSAPPAFPAAYTGVVAVTAIDQSGRVYRRANQGAHIDFSAPGVNIWTAASIRGAKRNTGTSFATPFVTATFAAAKAANQNATAAELRDQLQSTTIDLGKKGFDLVYGNGLIQTAKFCLG